MSKRFKGKLFLVRPQNIGLDPKIAFQTFYN